MVTRWMAPLCACHEYLNYRWESGGARLVLSRGQKSPKLRDGTVIASLLTRLPAGWTFRGLDRRKGKTPGMSWPKSNSEVLLANLGKCVKSEAGLKYSAHLEWTYQSQFQLPEGGLHKEFDGGGRGCQQSASSTRKKTIKNKLDYFTAAIEKQITVVRLLSGQQHRFRGELGDLQITSGWKMQLCSEMADDTASFISKGLACFCETLIIICAVAFRLGKSLAPAADLKPYAAAGRIPSQNLHHNCDNCDLVD